MSAQPQPTDEEIKAYEEQLARITAVDIAVQASASLLTVGGRKVGLAPGTEQERDLEQVRDAVDAVRALLPVVERRISAMEARPLRDALSQLQMAYAQLVQAAGAQGAGADAARAAQGSDAAAGADAAAAQDGSGPAAAGAPRGEAGQAPGGTQQGDGPQPASPEDSQQRRPGPAESSGRLWVPGS